VTIVTKLQQHNRFGYCSQSPQRP